MAYFARKIRYAASPTSFIAFIVIAKKKGGEPIKYIVYRAHFNDPKAPSGVYEMAEFNSLEDMKRYMPFGGLIEKWKKTTDWLYKVGTGGCFQEHRKGTWVKICSPYFRKRKKKKFVPKFGNLRHMLLIARKERELIEKELSESDLSPKKRFEDEGLRVARYKERAIIAEIQFKRAVLTR